MVGHSSPKWLVIAGGGGGGAGLESVHSSNGDHGGGGGSLNRGINQVKKEERTVVMEKWLSRSLSLTYRDTILQTL